MYPSVTNTRFTLGELLVRLRDIHQPDKKALAATLQMSYTTYLKNERGQRESSFLMILRICHFYSMGLHEFISMLSEEELGRNDISISKQKEKIEKKKLERAKAKVIDIKTEQVIPSSLL